MYEICYNIEPSSGMLILIKYGDRGYYKCDYSTDNEEENRALADRLNSRLGVSPTRAEAMLAGSLFGWDVPAARAGERENSDV